ncbi:MAG: hypothetical protein DME34_05070 [Verrucomicrobia bacterium]|nr:MAG: hypothetical protein DME34_05070 [Verrucomicrobiota bacterium]
MATDNAAFGSAASSAGVSAGLNGSPRAKLLFGLRTSANSDGGDSTGGEIKSFKWALRGETASHLGNSVAESAEISGD